MLPADRKFCHRVMSGFQLLLITNCILNCREIEDTVASLGDPSVAEASFFVAHFNYLCR